MVANWIENGELESEDFYSFPNIDAEDSSYEDPEQMYVNKDAAELHRHAQIYGQNNRLNENHQAAAQVLKTLQFQYVQQQWECLYNAN